MKNLKIISAILIASTFLGTTNITSAYTVNNNQTIQKLKDYREKQYLLKEYKKMQNMSIDELQNIISEIKIKSENKIVNETRSIVPIDIRKEILRANLKAAWLAAAQIAKRSGYPLAAELIESSIFGNPYGESDGKFAREIKKTSLYKNVLIKNRNGTDRFPKEIHADLFFAINKFKYFNSGKNLIITDEFNFEEAKGRFGFFTNIINDWALLNQNLGVLNPIDVTIYITK